MLTAEYLRSVLDYNRETGGFVWLSGRNKGKSAGCRTNNGYWYVGVGGSYYYAHRLAWLYVHGELPGGQIDHRDGDRLNNGIANLRLANAAENAQNRLAHRNNKSGFLGVTLRKGRYIAQIKSGEVHRQLGYFDNPLDAHKCYLAAKADLHAFQPTARQV